MVASHLRRPALALLAAMAVSVAAAPAAVPPSLVGSGVALIPADAAFLSATLRAREQYDRFVGSNAWAALRAIPAVKRAFSSLEEQRGMPGSPVSMADAVLSLPENAQAVELLADLAATDTFVYGEPSCAEFVQLARKLLTVVQAAGAMDDGDVFLEEKMELFDDRGGDEAAARREARRMRCQFGVEAGDAVGAVQKRMIVQTLVDNIDLIVVPDVVWGFRTTKPEAAKAQLARLEKLATAALADGDAVVDVDRARVAGGDFLVITLRGESLPWGELERDFAVEAEDIDGFDEVFDRLRELDLCVALGLVDDRVILSIGDSTDHLAKLGNPAAGLLSLPALAPVVEHADRKLTAISYASADMVRAIAQSRDDVERQFEAIATALAEAGVDEQAVEEARDLFERFGDAMADRLPRPGPWTAFSYLTDSGYEGQTWDWSRNQPLDGARRLDLIEHAGGAPLAVAVARLKSDPGLVDDVTDFAAGLWQLLQRHALPALDDDDRDRVEEAAGLLGPLTTRFVDVLRDKLLPAIVDGQVGLVIDDKSRTKKPQRDLPNSGEPLPLPELAIVLPIDDAKLFREGLSDLFEVGDDAVAAFRELDPDAVPRDYRIPDPVKAKVGDGTVWSFPIPDSGLDEQIRPAIGVGDEVAVFSLVPKQAARLLEAADLETGSQLATFEEPLAAAAALDVAGVVDAIRPWLVYLTRYGCVRDREGTVDADVELQAADETAAARDALASVDVVLEVAKCLRAAVAETQVRDKAVVTTWRNVIRDLPKR